MTLNKKIYWVLWLEAKRSSWAKTLQQCEECSLSCSLLQLCHRLVGGCPMCRGSEVWAIIQVAAYFRHQEKEDILIPSHKSLSLILHFFFQLRYQLIFHWSNRGLGFTMASFSRTPSLREYFHTCPAAFSEEALAFVYFGSWPFLGIK